MDEDILSLTVQIVSAHVSKNAVSADQLPSLIQQVHRALTTVSQAPVEATHAKTAVSVNKSVFADHLVCLVCGKQFKTLKRHLMSDHKLTPDQYRARFGLSGSYPMVSADYTKARSAMAKKLGLGRGERKEEPKKAGMKRG